MSLTIKDHRKHLQDVDKKKEAEEVAQPKPLLEQVQVASETGDPRLDKLMRAVASLIEKTNAHGMDAAIKCATAVNADQGKLMQLEYAFTKGREVAFLEVLKIPATIILEERGNPNVTQ